MSLLLFFNTPAAAGVVANASGTLSITGASSAQATVAPAASGTLAPTGQATAVAPIAVSASGSLVISGAADASAPEAAAAAGTLTPSGLSAAANPVTALAAGTLTLSGSADGSITGLAAAVTAPATVLDLGDGVLYYPHQRLYVHTKPKKVVVHAGGRLTLVGSSAASTEPRAKAKGRLTLSGSASCWTDPSSEEILAILLADEMAA
jgi:hypothetical protein